MAFFSEDVDAVEARFRDASSSPSDEPDRLETLYIGLNKGQPEPVFRRPKSVGELMALPSCDLRIIFAPHDRIRSTGIRELFLRLKIPSAYILEVEHTATSSFGYRSMKGGQHCIWFRSLCKNIPVDEHGRIKGATDALSWDKSSSQADESWHKSGFFVFWQDMPSADSLSECDRQASVSDHSMLAVRGDIAVDQIKVSRQVTACCWSASLALQARFANLVQDNEWDQALEDPFLLVDVILEDLYKTVNAQALAVGTVMGRIGKDTFELASHDTDSTTKFDFVGLANVQKHIIHLTENCGSLVDTAAAISERHNALFGNSALLSYEMNPELFDSTSGGLAHKQSLLRSTQMRLSSLEKRMLNITNLAFNFVAQADSIAIKRDSEAMQKIARVTLAMLPSATIAALFSTPFFYSTLDQAPYDANSSSPPSPSSSSPRSSSYGGLGVAPSFWIFWAISVPVTLALVALPRMAERWAGPRWARPEWRGRRRRQHQAERGDAMEERKA